MKTIKIKFEYGCFPVWVYNTSGQLMDNDLPPHLMDDIELGATFTHLQEIYDALFINDDEKFQYTGFPSAEASVLFKNELSQAIDLLKQKAAHEYQIEIMKK